MFRDYDLAKRQSATKRATAKSTDTTAATTSNRQNNHWLFCKLAMGTSKEDGRSRVPYFLPSKCLVLFSRVLSTSTTSSQYGRNKLGDPKVYDFRKYSRINFAFFQTNIKGDLWGTDTWADPNCLFGPYNWNGIEGVDTKYCSWDGPNLKVCNFHLYEEGLLYLVKQAGGEIWPSIGGWSLSDPFPEMAKDPVARENFAKNCVLLIEAYGFGR